MLKLQRYSTEAQPAHLRLDYWNEITGSALTSQIADPMDRESFRGRMTCLDMGEIRCVQLNASGSRVTRTRAQVGNSAEPIFLLRIALGGEIKIAQDGRDVLLRPGDFTLCDTSRPYQIWFREFTDVLIIRITRDRLLPYLSQPEAAVTMLMPGHCGLSGLASRHVRDLWNASGEFLAQGASRRMIETVLQLLAGAYSSIPQAGADDSCRTTASRAQILEFIEGHLADPELSPGMIADRLGITAGYLHRLYSDESGTVSRYILRRRLEECARALRDPLRARHHITRIAFAFGFNSMPHFSRVFRSQYGMSPRDYRQTFGAAVN